MRRRLAPFLMMPALLLVAGACGDDGGDGFPFEGTPGTVESAGTVRIEVGGESWELPAAVCLAADGDADIVLAAAEQAAQQVRSLVGHRVSGWPTTTWVSPDQPDTYAEDVRVAGVTALALAGLVGEQGALETAWRDYEQDYADPEGGWGPPYEISGRLSDWRAEAETLTQAIAAHCAGG